MREMKSRQGARTGGAAPLNESVRGRW